MIQKRSWAFSSIDHEKFHLFQVQNGNYICAVRRFAFILILGDNTVYIYIYTGIGHPQSDDRVIMCEEWVCVGPLILTPYPESGRGNGYGPHQPSQPTGGGGGNTRESTPHNGGEGGNNRQSKAGQFLLKNYNNCTPNIL